MKKLSDYSNKISLEEAQALGDELQLNWGSVDLNQFWMGLNSELEHFKTVGGNMKIIAEICLDHLGEDPLYYSKLRSAGL